jgi:hypothetical protein
VSGHLVGPPAFKAGEWSDPPLAGSIPVHLRRGRAVLAGPYTRRMKKLLVLVVFGGLLAVAAKKIKSV